LAFGPFSGQFVKLRGIEEYPPAYANEGFTQAFVIGRALQPAKLVLCFDRHARSLGFGRSV
jgi:hypothetical protein